MRRLHTLWKIQGDLRLVDLGNNIFLDKFSIPMTWALLSLGSMDGGRSLSYRKTMASSFYPIERSLCGSDFQVWQWSIMIKGFCGELGILLAKL